MKSEASDWKLPLLLLAFEESNREPAKARPEPQARPQLRFISREKNPTDDIVKEFVADSYEALDRLERDLIKLEKEPHQKETLGGIFRTIHSVKETGGFLGFGKLEAVADIGENLLSKLRDGVFTFNPELARALLATVDSVRYMLGQIELTGESGGRDFTDLINLLTRLNEGQHGTETAWPPIPQPEAAVAAPASHCFATAGSTPATGTTPPAAPTPISSKPAAPPRVIPRLRSRAVSEASLGSG